MIRESSCLSYEEKSKILWGKKRSTILKDLGEIIGTGLPRLYKKDSKGNLLEWQVSYLGNEVHILRGVQGTEKPQRNSEIASPKNVGKKNERSAAEQAKELAKQKWNKQVKRGYVEDMNKALEGNRGLPAFKPLKGFYFLKKEESVKYPVMVSPKKDGHRCIVEVVNGKAKPIHFHTEANSVCTSHSQGI